MADIPKLKLVYFDIDGKGEPIRLLLNYLGVEFEDMRFKSREEFIKMKTDGTLAFGQVPALFVGEDAVIVQSVAILRYIGKLGRHLGFKNLYPEDIIKAATVDFIMDFEADAFTGLRTCKYSARFGFSSDVLTEEAIESTKKTLNAEIIPKHLTNLQKCLEVSKSGWLADTSDPSIADFYWVPVLDSIVSGWTGDKDLLKNFPKLQDLQKKFHELEKVAEYRAKKKQKV
mmetsp:Transcript_17690/g.21456  ORF Transcript_17690/g.21456 Transcript_17690/m.21456 type:complete len:229 (-) Transcript_17690:166-852(-)|eukprot:CAMPEP_0184021104 /NCGR_PEP_ID=MMETSP0954-20121128/9728_1 /TAXON_ID=627963 /ORGANISM="Aplanochytrium sp, Strain PBS07" /LENGTH=228 /DNA_ID=CAMNT_0026303057 /DNA_START=76 /DNA_END=762 /DNA_ORIENTATION=-